MKDIFVFGSNLAGRHGKGSAKEALEHHGAILGQGEGLQGSAYAIPTKSKKLQVLSLLTIRLYVNQFLEFAKAHQEMQFHIVAIGTGLAGYTTQDIAPLFADAPENCILPQEFRTFLDESM